MIALIDKYFPDLTRPQRGQFEALYALYADWNTSSETKAHARLTTRRNA